jgi:hypothetical protein
VGVGNKPSSFRKDFEFLERLSDCCFPKKDSASCSYSKL